MRYLLSAILLFFCLGLPGCATAGAFDQSFARQGLRFRVTCANDSSINTLSIIPDGLTVANDPVALVISGTVAGADMADLNADGFPELYIYVASVGSGSYGELIAYGSNRNKSLTPIYLPPLMQNETLAKGYMGHDSFSIGDGVLQHRFPLYREGDSNAAPTGGHRQIHYKLTAGGSGWVLEIEQVVDQ